MRRYLMHAPWWVHSVVNGVPFGAFVIVTAPLLRSIEPTTAAVSPTFNIVAGSLTGMLFGAVIGPVIARRNRRTRSVVGPLLGGDFAVVLRAAVRGPIPADPMLRSAARRLAQFRLDELTRKRAFSLGFFVLFGVLMIYQAVTTSVWLWLGVPLVVYSIILHLWLSRRLRQRVERLRADDGPQPSPTTATLPTNRH